jgi:hypothetical protein
VITILDSVHLLFEAGRPWTHCVAQAGLELFYPSASALKWWVTAVYYHVFWQHAFSKNHFIQYSYVTVLFFLLW